MRTRRRLVAEETGLGEIWPSFADVTSTIALIFFALVLLSYVRDLVSSRRLAAYEQQINSSERKLRLLEGDLARTRLEIEAGQARLARSEKDVAEQQAVISASSLELATLRSRLSGIALLRVDVLDRVKRALESELGTVTRQGAPLVRIGDNGNIVINEGLVFDASSYSLKPEGKALLATLAVALENVLADGCARTSMPCWCRATPTRAARRRTTSTCPPSARTRCSTTCSRPIRAWSRSMAASLRPAPTPSSGR